MAIAQITGTYFFLLFGLDSLANSILWSPPLASLPRHHVRDHAIASRYPPAAVVPARVRVPDAVVFSVVALIRVYSLILRLHPPSVPGSCPT